MTLKEKVHEKIEEMKMLKKVKEMSGGMNLNAVFDVYSKTLLDAKKKIIENELLLEIAEKKGDTKKIAKVKKDIAEQTKWLDFVENKIGINGRMEKAASGFRTEKDK